jgi:chromosome segregation ATPase
MSSINQNTIRTPRIHLRSATRRRNNPTALARRTLALETRRTNLANTIRELEADLRQQRAALDALTIEVDQALSRREDDKERYETLSQQEEDLKNTIRDNIRQSNFGMKYIELKQHYDELVKNRGIDTDNIEKQLHEIGYTFKQLIREQQVKTNFSALNAEKKLAHETYRLASEHHYSVYQQQQSLMRIVSDLEHRLTRALISDRALNQARGKRQRKSRGKRGKKGGAWTAKYKKSINCNRPRGFSQKQYCKYGR